MPQLTGAQMKYLHVIYKAGKGSDGIRSVDVARELQVTKASVSRMVKLLSGMGLISVKEHGKINLTAKGMLEAGRVDSKIAEIHPFFADFLKLCEPEATDSAYSFLSAFSEHCVNELRKKSWSTAKTG